MTPRRSPYVLPFLPGVRELLPPLGVPSLVLVRKTPIAALRESPSLRNTFRPTTWKSPGLMCTLMALLRMLFGMEGQESTSSAQEAKKTKLALLLAYTSQNIKLKQKPWKQQQPILMSAIMPLLMLSSLRMPCPSCRPSSQTGILTTRTCLLRLPRFVEAMQSPCNGFPSTETCLATRLLTLWQRKAQQRSKWIGPLATLRWRPSSRPSNIASGGTSTHGTPRPTPTTC